MNSNYLFIGGCALGGGLIYNAFENIYLKSYYDENRRNIFNYGMLFGIGLGSSLYYLKHSNQLLLKSSE